MHEFGLYLMLGSFVCVLGSTAWLLLAFVIPFFANLIFKDRNEIKVLVPGIVLLLSVAVLVLGAFIAAVSPEASVRIKD